MTAIRDPYPESLSEIDEQELGFGPSGLANPDGSLVQDPQVRALNRIAVALEQLTLAVLDRPQAVQNAPGAALASLPPIRPVQTQIGWRCPVHGAEAKTVPAGVSKRTGAAYDAFQVCSVKGCDQRPPR